MLLWLRLWWLKFRLRSRDYGAQITAEKALQKLADPRAVRWLLPWLKGEGELVTKCAGEALRRLADQRAVDPLIKLLTDGGLSFGENYVIDLLGILGDKRAVDPLLKSLSPDPYVPYGYLRAIEAIGKLGGSRAVDGLLQVLEQRTTKAANALGKQDAVGRTLTVALVEALGKIGDTRAVDELLAALRQGNAEAAAALGKLGAVAELTTALNDSNLHVCHAAAVVLGGMGITRAVDELASKALNYHDLMKQELAVSALQSLGWKPAHNEERLEMLVAKALFGNTCEERRDAIDEAKDIGAARAFDLLLESLGVVGRTREGWAIEFDRSSSGRFPRATSTGHLVHGTSVRSRLLHISQRAAQALRRLDDKRSAEPIRAVIEQLMAAIEQRNATISHIIKQETRGPCFPHYRSEVEWHFWGVDGDFWKAVEVAIRALSQ